MQAFRYGKFHTRLQRYRYALRMINQKKYYGDYRNIQTAMSVIYHEYNIIYYDVKIIPELAYVIFDKKRLKFLNVIITESDNQK